jgi:hypothetical protein
LHFRLRKLLFKPHFSCNSAPLFIGHIVPVFARENPQMTNVNSLLSPPVRSATAGVCTLSGRGRLVGLLDRRRFRPAISLLPSHRDDTGLEHSRDQAAPPGAAATSDS